jgi:hypothetical protein
VVVVAEIELLALELVVTGVLAAAGMAAALITHHLLAALIWVGAVVVMALELQMVNQVALALSLFVTPTLLQTSQALAAV